MVDPVQRCVDAAAAELDEAGTASDTTLPATSDRVAIVVGVPCHRTAGIPSLAFSSRDAEQVAQILGAADYDVIRLTHLVDRADFVAALSAAEATLSPKGSLVIYFSGHGVLREDQGKLKRYLVFSDTELADVRQTGVSVLSLDERVSKVPAQSRIVVQDTCFAAEPGGKSLGLAGSAGSRIKGIAAPEPRLALEAGDARLYASRFFEQAVEDPSVRGSLYTHHLLKALAQGEADLDGDGCVGLTEAHSWARDRTSEVRGGFQTPLAHFHDANVTLGCTPRQPTHGVLQLPQDETWSVDVRDGSGALVRSEPGSVPPGRYRVVVGHLKEVGLGQVARHTVMNRRLKVKPGDWIDLTSEAWAARKTLTSLAFEGTYRSRGEQLPILGAGFSVMHLRGHTRIGRPLLGARVHGGAGMITHQGKETTASTFGGSLLLGMQLSLHQGKEVQLGTGPVLGFGPYRWTPVGTNGDPLPTEWTNIGLLALRTQLVIEPLTFAVEAGASATPRIVGKATEFEVRPVIRIGVGPAL